MSRRNWSYFINTQHSKSPIFIFFFGRGGGAGVTMHTIFMSVSNLLIFISSMHARRGLTKENAGHGDASEDPSYLLQKPDYQ